MPSFFPRSPWPAEFPDVIIHGDLRVRNAHRSYIGAKSGDAEAAKVLVEEMLSVEVIEHLARLAVDRNPLLLPITAEEVAGFNAIPDAMAQALGRRLRLTAKAGAILQASKVEHTKADGWHRLATPVEFIGEVIAGADYILVDDHVGFGGTLANLRGFIEHNGGTVIAMTTLTETRAARQIAIRAETLNLLYSVSMVESSQTSGSESSDTASIVSPTSKPDTYFVLNRLSPSRLEWLRQQSLHVAEVFRRSDSTIDPK